MTVKVILRCAPILTKDDLLDAENVRHHEMYQTGSLTPVRRGVDANGKDIYIDVPICVNHESSNVVGVVTHLREDSDHTGGRWLFAHARIDKPPGWLNRDTSVSISYKCLNRSSGLGGDWSRVLHGWLTEISLLSPSREPAHPRARVVWLEPVEKPSASPVAVRTTSDRAAAGETFDLRPSAYDELEWLVGYRITDENFETALTRATRSPIEKAYDEHMAAKRARSGPQVLIRPGIGRVLAVGGVPVR